MVPLCLIGVTRGHYMTYLKPEETSIAWLFRLIAYVASLNWVEAFAVLLV